MSLYALQRRLALMTGKQGSVVTLLPPTCSLETVETLEFLLGEARAGRLMGLAWISLHPGGRYNVDVTGEAGEQPEFVLGLTRVLMVQLEKLLGLR